MKIIFKGIVAAFLFLVIFPFFSAKSVQAKPVQSIVAGTGINVEGTEDVTVSIDKQFRLPQNCTEGQITAWNGRRWRCAYNGLSLPFVATGTWDSRVFSLTNSGLGGVGQFRINNQANTTPALEAFTDGSGNAIDAYTTGNGSAISAGTEGDGFAALSAINNGTGIAGVFSIERPENTSTALQVKAGHQGSAFQSYMWGTGMAGDFTIDNAGNTQPALRVSTNGSGTVINATTQGSGRAGSFASYGSDRSEPTFVVESFGSGLPALQSTHRGTGAAGYFSYQNPTGEGGAIYAESNGLSGTAYLVQTNPASPFYALGISSNSVGGGLAVNSNGLGPTAWFGSGNPENTSNVLAVGNQGSGWLGYFSGMGKGVYISVPEGNEGLNVASGTKNAVVATNDGARLLYTEESSQVWFTDYGFGKLKNGVAKVWIDPLFAQTVNLNEPYHVFVQSYGDSNLYVTNRTRTGFEVRAREGNSDVEFSYRLVAKRRGYESNRLERAEWADKDTNLYPTK